MGATPPEYNTQAEGKSSAGESGAAGIFTTGSTEEHRGGTRGKNTGESCGLRKFGYASGDLVVPTETRQAASLRESFLELTHQLAQRLLIRRAGYASFGDDRGYEFCGRHVEGWVFDLDSVGHHLLAGNVGDLSGVALLDGNFAAVGRGEIDG